MVAGHRGLFGQDVPRHVMVENNLGIGFALILHLDLAVKLVRGLEHK